ncbi:Ada metal-binding domain-containing protein [Nonomuraea sp. WAC 01424]|uniref:Ada metal-binding domain-containing protein n=1 Tax=Nonomuraea sp. WAC 01424 TaxID=2203200 RepID=UPI0021AE1D3B|nr:Ada metal-binding domain-containing protein [Nonomuraea sp. WAC 01424]
MTYGHDAAYQLVGVDGRAYLSPVPGTLGGHRRARLYGRLDCPSALRAVARGGYVRHRVFFADAATAVAAGYRPCAVCLPREYAVWKAAGDRRELDGVLTLLRAQRPRAEAVVIGHGRDGAHLGAAFAAAWEGTVLAVVAWPETAASWLRQARRFTAGAPDAWVVAGAPAGWAGMSERLRRSTDWDPDRTYGFAATARAVALAGPGTLEGMRGADTSGEPWKIGRNLIYREPS